MVLLLRLLGHESTPQNTHVFTLIILCLCFKRNMQIYEFSIRNVVAEQIVHGAFVKIAATALWSMRSADSEV